MPRFVLGPWDGSTRPTSCAGIWMAADLSRLPSCGGVCRRACVASRSVARRRRGRWWAPPAPSAAPPTMTSSSRSEQRPFTTLAIMCSHDFDLPSLCMRQPDHLHQTCDLCSMFACLRRWAMALPGMRRRHCGPRCAGSTRSHAIRCLPIHIGYSFIKLQSYT